MSVVIKNISDLVKRDGVYFMKFSNVPFDGVIEGETSGSIKNGLMVGLWNNKNSKGEPIKDEYWHLGKRVFSGFYKDGRKDGEWTYFEENEGDQDKLYIHSKGKYKNGNKVGKWISYEPNSDHVSKKEVWKDDNIISKKFFLKGKKEGNWEEYHSNGQLAEYRQYKNDKRDGMVTQYDGNGKVIADIKFSKGFIVEGKNQINFFEFKKLLSDKKFQIEEQLYEHHYHGLKEKRSGDDFNEFVRIYAGFREPYWQYEQFYEQYFEVHYTTEEPLEDNLGNFQKITYLPNKCKSLIENYRKGLLHGEWKWLGTSGRTIVEGTFKNGFAEGEWKYRFGVIAVTSGSITEASEACSLLLKRKFSCFVVNSE